MGNNEQDKLPAMNTKQISSFHKGEKMSIDPSNIRHSHRKLDFLSSSVSTFTRQMEKTTYFNNTFKAHFWKEQVTSNLLGMQHIDCFIDYLWSKLTCHCIIQILILHYKSVLVHKLAGQDRIWTLHANFEGKTIVQYTLWWNRCIWLICRENVTRMKKTFILKYLIVTLH